MLAVLKELLPFLAALYLLDCLTFTRRDQRLISCCCGLDFRLWRGGLAVAGVLPLDQAFAIGRFTVVATGKRLYLPPEETRGGAAYRQEMWTTLPYAETGKMAVWGKEIRFDAGRRLLLASAAEAREVAAMIRELVALAPGERESHAAAWLSRRLDAEQARARHAASAGRSSAPSS
jgi:hypothetical protein